MKDDSISRKDAIEAARQEWMEHQNIKLMQGYIEGNNDAVEGVISKIESLPSATRPTDEEDQLKFYYVESIDDYWVGRRLDNFYYANWHEDLGFVWSHSRYLPWGEHIVDETTLWKEHTYPSEPVEMPFTDWIVGFVKKYFATRPTGRWRCDDDDSLIYDTYTCSECKKQITVDAKRECDIGFIIDDFKFCPNCGAIMQGGDAE